MPSISQQRVTFMDQFVDQVREALKQRNMSIAELARRVGVSRPYIHRVLSREHNPSLEWVDRVAKELQITVQVGGPKT